jgi:hypothetical protein
VRIASLYYFFNLFNSVFHSPPAVVSSGLLGVPFAKTLGRHLLRMINLESLRKLGCRFGGIKRSDSVPLLDLQC